MITPDQMRTAADTLEAWGKRMEYYDPTKVQWSAEELRREAGHLESELCGRPSLGGPRCALDKDHDGKHSAPWRDGGSFNWDDKSQQDQFNRSGGTSGT